MHHFWIIWAQIDAYGQTYPAKSITVVVPFPAGGPSDVVARIVTEHMSRTLRRQMVIENVGGAGGTLGSARVAAAQPDGYTLLAGSMGSHVAAPVLTPNVKYDSERDFEPIGLTAHSPAVIVARKDFPARDPKEFVSFLKQNADQVKEAHGGVGASSHMACLLFNQALDIRPTLVAYRGTAPAMNDLVGGHVDFLCEIDGACIMPKSPRDGVGVRKCSTDSDPTFCSRTSIRRCPLFLAAAHQVEQPGHARPRV